MADTTTVHRRGPTPPNGGGGGGGGGGDQIPTEEEEDASTSKWELGWNGLLQIQLLLADVEQSIIIRRGAESMN